MTFRVYGLRLIGDLEARYIGQTAFKPERRLRFLLCEAKLMPGKTAFAEWLIANEGSIEAFVIAKYSTRFLVRIGERQIIEACLALNHRLFNRHHVPRERQAPARKYLLQGLPA